MAWDVTQYEAYRDERARPFYDLFARIPNATVGAAVDLGCGTGELTRRLLDRWPDARVVGVDNSAEMLAAAAPRAVSGKLSFVLGDAAGYIPDQPLELRDEPAMLTELELCIDSGLERAHNELIEVRRLPFGPRLMSKVL